MSVATTEMVLQNPRTRCLVIEPQSPYKTAKKAAEHLRATEWTIMQAIRAGDLPHAKIGKRFVVCVADLDAYFDRRKVDV
jgi:excisionase family DNA binding protein